MRVTKYGRTIFGNKITRKVFKTTTRFNFSCLKWGSEFYLVKLYRYRIYKDGQYQYKNSQLYT